MILIHIYHNSIYLNAIKAKTFPLMLTRACIDPFSKHYSELYKLFKFDQILLLLYSVSFIYCNTYLFKFLQTQNEQNRTQTRDDFNRRRVRNLVPAKVGVLHAIALVLTYVGKYPSVKSGLGTVCPKKTDSC